MVPCNDNCLRLDDPDEFIAYADVIKTLTDPSRFENYLFMPVTRGMTIGQRTLLHRFLDASVSTVHGQPTAGGGTCALGVRGAESIATSWVN